MNLRFTIYDLPKAFLLAVFVALPSQSAPLDFSKAIPLPDVQGRFDHFAIDVRGHRLFVAALGNNTLEVIDLAAGKHLRSVAGMSKPTGVLYLLESNQIWVANGESGVVKVLDGTSYENVHTIGPLPDADNLRYDAKSKKVYVGYGEGALGVIDSATAKLETSIKFPAHPESFQLEAKGTRIFVNVPGAKQIAVIDREKQRVIETWPVEKFQANFPMALDETNQRVFVGCRKPARLVILNTSTGKAVGDLTIAGDIDDLFFNAMQKQLYLSCGEGFLEVVGQYGPDNYRLTERSATAPGARTGFFSPERKEFYLAVPRRGERAAEIRIFKIES
jgi:DNA-binding beta-propeller fold protein YncE